MTIRCLMILPFVCFTSCATITRGVHDKLTVLSDPPGADVRLSTGEHGVTPAKFVKSRKGEDFTVTVSKAGYIAQTVKVHSEFSATGGTAMGAGALAGGVISVGIDAVSGAYNSLYPNPVSVHLSPVQKSKPPKHSTTSSSQRKAQPKSKTTKSSQRSETMPAIEVPSRPESPPTPAPTATPYVPPTLESSPSP